MLTSYELFLIFYYCLSPTGAKEFKSLVEKYNLLKNLPEKLIFGKKHKTLYNLKTFK